MWTELGSKKEEPDVKGKPMWRPFPAGMDRMEWVMDQQHKKKIRKSHHMYAYTGLCISHTIKYEYGVLDVCGTWDRILCSTAQKRHILVCKA